MSDENQSELRAMIRRWVYMIVAIVAAGLLPTRPVFNFQEDRGIIYVRSFSMDKTMFYVTQTELRTGAEEITDSFSVAWMYYCARALFWLSVACFLCFFSNRWRMILCIITMLCAGAYYLFMIYYALKITEDCYTTLYPNLMTVLPAIVLQMMVLTRASVARLAMTRNEDEERDQED